MVTTPLRLSGALPTMIRPPQSPGWRWPAGRDDVKTIGAYPTATEIRMEAVPQKTSTTMTFSDVQYDTRLSDSVFETKP